MYNYNMESFNGRPRGKLRVFIPIASHIILFSLFLLEYALFTDYVASQVAPFYPPYFDQAYFLMETYRLYEEIRASGSHIGWVNVLIKELFSSDAQGHLLHIQTNLFMLHAGASRFTALLPNFIYFIVLQYAFFRLVKSVTESYAMGFLVVGLLLSISYPFYFAGALSDYRLDFISFCIYGLFSASVIASNSFLNKKGTVYATLFSYLLVLFRHVTVAYIGMTYLLMLIIIGIFYLRSDSVEYKQDCMARIRHIILSGMSILVVMAPFIWLSRVDIYNYYGRHHVLGLDKEFRLAHAKVFDFLSNLLYYPTWLKEHLGSLCFSMVALILLLALVFIIVKRINERKASVSKAGGANPSAARNRILFATETYAFLALLTVVPIAIITFDYNKSPVVAAGVIPPLLLFIVLVFSNTLRGVEASFNSEAPLSSRGLWNKYAGVVVMLMTTAIFIGGLNNQIISYNRPSGLSRIENLDAISRMYEEVGDWAVKNKSVPVLIAVDRMSDYLTNGTFSIVYFEKKSKFLPVVTMLGRGLRTISREEALADLRSSAIVFFSESPAGISRNSRSFYPYDTAIDALRPELKEIVAKEFEFFKEYDFDGMTFRVYVRPDA